MALKFEFWFTQTSHSVAFVCTLLLVVVTSTFWKGDPASGSQTTTVFPTMVRTAHLGCFGAWFGAQVWVTFFAGNIFTYRTSMNIIISFFSPLSSSPSFSFSFSLFPLCFVPSLYLRSNHVPIPPSSHFRLHSEQTFSKVLYAWYHPLDSITGHIHH